MAFAALLTAAGGGISPDIALKYDAEAMRIVTTFVPRLGGFGPTLGAATLAGLGVLARAATARFWWPFAIKHGPGGNAPDVVSQPLLPRHRGCGF